MTTTINTKISAGIGALIAGLALAAPAGALSPQQSGTLPPVEPLCEVLRTLHEYGGGGNDAALTSVPACGAVWIGDATDDSGDVLVLVLHLNGQTQRSITADSDDDPFDCNRRRYDHRQCPI